MKFLEWNLDEITSKLSEHYGWFLWPYIEKIPELHNESIEIKWIRHKKWERKEWSLPNKKTQYLVILIEGKYKVLFPEKKKEFILHKQGDIFLFDPSESPHTWESLEDSLLMVIRFNSK